MHNHRFVESEVAVKKGKEQDKVFEDKKTKSGNTILRHFCVNCVRQNIIFICQISQISPANRFTGHAALSPAFGISWSHNLARRINGGRQSSGDYRNVS